MSESMICLKQGVGRNPLTRLKAPADFLMGRQEHIVIAGANGAGKSLLTDLIMGATPLREGSLTYDFSESEENMPWGEERVGDAVESETRHSSSSVYGNVIQMRFDDVIGSVENPYYFQQRFNSQDRDESPFLRDLLPEGCVESPLIDEFKMRPLLDKRIVMLSSGEMRRYRLLCNLWKSPKVLIMDNPFIGLDAAMREQLHDIFRLLTAKGKTQLIMLISICEDIPDYMTHVVEVVDGVVQPKLTREEFLRQYSPCEAPLLEAVLRQEIERLSDRSTCGAEEERNSTSPRLGIGQGASLSDTTAIKSFPDDEIISLRDLSLAVEDGRMLYGGLNWTVHRGEKWALQGGNGSGKSTLLSLITADHPAAYACDISLFGKKRGSGESIWDIKKHIGFVSPEFHRAYRQNIQAIDIVASGLHDSVGLYKRSNPEQHEVCKFWMRVFRIEHLQERAFLTLSSGEQRLCLLARAFVKDPDLLILDEPLHGLDSFMRQYVKEVISCFCSRPSKTLIMVSHYEEEFPDVIDHRLVIG